MTMPNASSPSVPLNPLTQEDIRTIIATLQRLADALVRSAEAQERSTDLFKLLLLFAVSEDLDIKKEVLELTKNKVKDLLKKDILI